MTAGVEPRLSAAQVLAALPPAEQARHEALSNEQKAVRRQQQRAAVTKTYAAVAVARPPVVKLLHRGNPAAERESVSPGGIVAVAGGFAAGDPVDLVRTDGRPVARGLVNFDAEELPGLLGRSSHDLKRELGAAYEREVVHRDDLVVLGR